MFTVKSRNNRGTRVSSIISGFGMPGLKSPIATQSTAAITTFTAGQSDNDLLARLSGIFSSRARPQ